MKPRIAVLYYSATGTTHALARAIADGVVDHGGEVRLARAAELAPPEAIARNPAWAAHAAATRDVPVATVDDLAWADGYALGTNAAAGGNPYGISATHRRGEPVSPASLAAARYHGRRLAAFAELLATHRAARRAA